MLGLCKELCEYYREKDESTARCNLGVPHFAPRASRAESDLLQCHAIVHNLHTCVMSYNVVPNATQCTFIDMMIRALIPFIYLKYWDSARDAILNYHGVPRCEELVSISTPRQFGKTTALCMFVAAALYHVPGYVAYTFSMGQRQAITLGSITRDFLCQIPGGESCILKRNEEETVVSRSRVRDDPCNASLHTMPGRADKCRGFRPVQVLLEEAGFIDAELFYGTIVPALGVVGRSCVAISSPPINCYTSFFSKLSECKTADGLNVFANIRLEAVCADCKEKKADACPHMGHIRPAWKDEYRDQLQRAIYQGDMSYYRREVLGQNETPDILCYDTASVSSAFNRPPYVFTQPPRSIYLCIDPSGGGAGSDTSWVFLAHAPNGDAVIMGSNSISMKNVHPSKEVEMLRADITRLRSNRLFVSSTLYIIIEANHCFLRAHQIAEPLAYFEPCVVYSQDVNAPGLKRVGVWVDEPDKRRFVQQLAAAFLRQRVVTSTPYFGDSLTKDTLMQQACDYRRTLKHRRTNEVVDPVWSYTGKRAGKKDDIIMALMIVMYYADVIRFEARG